MEKHQKASKIGSIWQRIGSGGRGLRQHWARFSRPATKSPSAIRLPVVVKIRPPERINRELPTTGADESVDREKGLVRAAFPAELIARARELGKPEHAGVAQICRRALEKELELMRRQQSPESPRRQKNR
jgi:hypothetical protein